MRRVPPLLRDMAEKRGVWAIVIILALLLALALYGYLTGSWEAI